MEQDWWYWVCEGVLPVCPGPYLQGEGKREIWGRGHVRERERERDMKKVKW